MITFMFVTLCGFLLAVVIGNVDLNALLKDAVENVFKVENLIDSWFNSMDVMTNLNRLLVSISISILIFKFVKKGFGIYVMETDGDNTESPQFLVINFLRSFVALALYLPAYEQIILIVKKILNLIYSNLASKASLLERIIESRKPSAEDFYASGVDPMNKIAMAEYISKNSKPHNVFQDIMVIIITILILILFFKLISKGIELYILRLGLPLAIVGLMDNDKGIFKEYVTLLIQAMATILVQVFLMQMSIMMTLHVAEKFDLFAMGVGIGLTLTAFKTPSILEKFLIPQRSYGKGIIGRAAMSANMLRNLVFKK